MEIQKEQRGNILTLRLTGRLDAYSADHLGSDLSEIVRTGTHHIELNLAAVDYLSSAGIRVLVKWSRELRQLRGALAIAEPSDFVLEVLKLSGLDKALLRPIAEAAPEAQAPQARVEETETARFEVYEQRAGARLKCRCLGDAAPLASASYEAEHCEKAAFPAECYGCGIGAFGNDFADCRGRFGEFIAAAGAVAYMPTDGTNMPDYMAAAGTLVPEIHVLSGAQLGGHFSHLLRFVPQAPHTVVGITELAAQALAATGGDAAGFVIAAETSGLVGAALRRPPVGGAESESIFHHPEVREWMMFTSERAFDHSLCVVVGLVAKAESACAGGCLRPLSRSGELVGRIQAAALSYSPLQQGEIELGETVKKLFETESLRGVLHLINDDRPIAGVGQSEFTRGAMWCSRVEFCASA